MGEIQVGISYEALELALRQMKPRQKLYELVKQEMQRRGRWKNKNRGANPPRLR